MSKTIFHLDVGPVSTSMLRNFQIIFGSGQPDTQSVIDIISFSAQNRFSSTPGANHGAHAKNLDILKYYSILISLNI